MIQGKSSRRAAAATLLIIMLNNLFAPAVSYALTAGPTQPEATSFEPVDTTDMVNLQTGKLAYNIPLLDVPGPEGGYPLSLSYHSGIQPNEDASWVGLGWTLNPGALNRSVNGYADDWKNPTGTVRNYWQGGTTSTYTAGVTIGLFNAPLSVTASLSFSHDTYAGFGSGVDFSASAVLPVASIPDVPDLGPLTETLTATSNGGIGALTTSTGITYKPFSLGKNFTFSGTAGLSWGTTLDPTGWNITGLKTTASIGLAYGVKHPFSIGNTDTWTYDFLKDVPSYSTNFTFGFNPNNVKKPPILKDNGSDVAEVEKKILPELFKPRSANTGGLKAMTLNVLGGTLNSMGKTSSATYLNYTASMSSAKAASVTKKTSGFTIPIPTPVPGFSFSFGYSKMRYYTDETTTMTTQGSLWSTNAGHGTSIPNNVAFDTYSLPADPSEKNFLDQPDLTVQQGGSFPAFDDYNVNAQGLGGSIRPYQFQGQVYGQDKQNANSQALVQYYSPAQTVDPMPQFRFVDDFSNTYQQQPNAYSSTQMTDNATLAAQPLPFDPAPVYGNNDGTNGFKNNQLAGSRYISTTPLVAPLNALGYTPTTQAGAIQGFSITNESGVTYTYGLAAYSSGEEAYQELIDHTSNGYHLNRQTKPTPYAYTWYLTSITGPDYVDRNNDGKADDGDWGYWVDFEYGKWASNYIWRNPSEGYNMDEDNVWQDCSIGYREVYYLNAIRTRSHVALFEKEVRMDAKGEGNSVFTKDPTQQNYTYPGIFDATSTPSLKLTHIYLLNASDENIVTPSSGNLPGPFGTIPGNVLDASDVNAVGRANLEAKALRVIDFNTDYALCQGTSNSFNIPGQLSGKLTLESLGMRGNGGATSFPPMRFQYDLGNAAVTQTGVTISPVNGTTPAQFTTTNANFNPGDLIYSSSLGVYCGVITARSAPSGGVYTYTLANCNYTGSSTTATINTTKNPPYNKNAYDAWGMYKSDIDINQIAADVNVGHFTSPISTLGTDAWCLRSVTTQLGSQVNFTYEPDSYNVSSSDPYPQQSLIISKTVVNLSNNTITMTIDKGGNNSLLLANYYNIGDPISAIFSQEFIFGLGSPGHPQNGNDSWGNWVVDTRTNTVTLSDYPNNTSQPNYYAYENRNIYQVQPLFGGPHPLTVASIDDVNNTITLNCADPTLLSAPGASRTSNVIRSSTPPTNFNYTVWQDQSYGGNLFLKGSVVHLGGGVHVKSVSVTEQVTGVVQTTNYSYNDANGNTTGVSSYSPSLDFPCFNFPLRDNTNTPTFQPTGNTNPFVYTIPQYALDYRRAFYGNTALLFSTAREVPAPGVLYGMVSVSKQVKNPDESTPRNVDGVSNTQYQFETYKGNMAARFPVNTQTGSTTTNPAISQTARYYAVDNFTSCVGNLKSVIQFDNNGNKLMETDYHFLHDALILADPTAQAFMTDYKALLSQYHMQGYIQERFAEVKQNSQQPVASDNGVKSTITMREELPCIPTGQTTIDYVHNTQTTITNKGFDLYSGAVTSSVETDSYGNSILTQTIPAYMANNSFNTTPVYPALGLKVTNPANKNMLSQQAETVLYKLDGSGNRSEVVSAAATTWTDGYFALDNLGTTHVQNGQTEVVGGATVPNGDIWRPQYSYKYMPATTNADGLTSYPSGFSDFNFASLTTNPAWQQISAITLFDVNSKVLEEEDIDGNFSAIRMGYNNTKVVAGASPANYYEVAYSGAEDEQVTSANPFAVQQGNGSVDTDPGMQHTGSRSLIMGSGPGSSAFVYTVPVSKLTAGRNYIANVWARSGSTTGNPCQAQLYYTVGGSTFFSGTASTVAAQTGKTDGAWTLLTLSIPATAIATAPAGTSLVVGCTNNDPNHFPAVLDDFKFQPANAGTSAFVYDPFSGELTYIIDNNDLYTRFDYDPMGRLAHTYKEKFSTGEIRKTQYQYNMGSCPFTNSVDLRYLTKNDCGSGMSGSIVPYTIPAGRYCSTSGLADVQAQADNDVVVNGQVYANSFGACFVGGNVQTSATGLTTGSPAEIVFFNATTGLFAGNFVFANGISYYNEPEGTYNCQVIQLDNVPRTVTLSGLPPQTGSTVTFNNVTLLTNQLTVTVQ